MTNNKRIYFIDPIKAAYMAREFGVTIHGLMGENRKYPHSSDWEEIINFRCGRMYVDEKSYDRLDPMIYSELKV